MSNLRLRVDGRTFRDPHNREITLHGINVAGDAKCPSEPSQTSHTSKDFFEGDKVSFHKRPFTVDDAPTHFSRLRKWGYNTIRYIFTWEAIEAAGPGKYDEQWIEHTIGVLRVAKKYGFYIFMDPHQDVWSRFCGGSGAPMWTLYACGLDPKKFAVTQAALVQNTWQKPEEYPKMIWATNYTRMACQTIFTLFFGGKDFAPKAIIDGKNIQDYLQDHLIAACKHLARRIREAGNLENDVVIGWESMNEPNRGLITWPDLSVTPSEQKLQKGPSPTAWQAILTGSGRACEVDTYDFGGLGSYKSGTTLVDPKGEIAWLLSDYDDTFYGWKRDPGWKLGECIWAQHGVWNPSTDELLRKDYFHKDPKTGKEMNYEYFTNHYFMEYYRKYRDAIRSIFPNTIMLCQPPVLEIPPSIKDTKDDDSNMIFTPHYYDGITLITKKWYGPDIIPSSSTSQTDRNRNRVWNVDVFGVLRGKYWTPALAIRIGETAIRNCLRDQLSAIRQEGEEYMGKHPCLFSEIGIPYDMDDKYAYKSGDYSSQISAMDANHFALEGSGAAGFTLWVYVASNDHFWGDQWNGEDLSIFSLDDRAVASRAPLGDVSQTSLNPSSPSFSQSQTTDTDSVVPSNLKRTLTSENMRAQSFRSSDEDSDEPGLRAAEAYVRPTPIVTHGDIQESGFNLKNCTFTLKLVASSATPENLPTEVFLPEFHFPQGSVSVETSGGKWTISIDESEAAPVQKFKWWHAVGDQHVTIRGVKRRLGKALGAEEEDGYLDQYRERLCTVM
ncbi:MAG: hypothetical protein M1822_008827 [Bathelium mastoideum]|nr:MAG: hypothetical protein M1822_008827 [Bathelium mastoideum]